MEVETERLRLRPLEDGDAAFVLELVNEPAWKEFIGDRGIRDVGAARAYVARISEHDARHGFALACVVSPGLGRVGICGLVRREGLDAPDLGFAFLERFRGRGLAREAATAALRHAHRELGIRRVLAVTVAANQRSLKLLHAIGFRDLGTAPGEAGLLLLGHDDDPSMAARFAATWRRAGAAGDPAPVHADLVRRHAEPHRAYHVLAHVEHALDELDASGQEPRDRALVELALWWHDAVMEPLARDNEARSADLAEACARDMGLSPERQAELRRLVLATRHASPVAPGDAALVVDADLSILGQPASRFERYERDVRREYARVPLPLYLRGRARILRSLLERPSIYATPWFRERYEARARENLRASLSCPRW